MALRQRSLGHRRVGVGVERGLGGVGQNLAGGGRCHHDVHGIGVVLAAGVVGELLHGVLDVDVQGQHHLVAEYLGPLRRDGVRREHVVERVFDALQAHVVHADEAQHVRRQLALRVGARLLRLQVDAAQLAALARRADGRGLLGGNVTPHEHEAVAAEQAQHFVRAHAQDVGEQRCRRARVNDRRRPGGHRVALDGNRQHTSVAVQDRTALHFRQAHHRVAGRMAVHDHERGVADDKRRHAEHQKQHEQDQAPGSRVASGRLRRGQVHR